MRLLRNIEGSRQMTWKTRSSLILNLSSLDPNDSLMKVLSQFISLVTSACWCIIVIFYCDFFLDKIQSLIITQFLPMVCQTISYCSMLKVYTSPDVYESLKSWVLIAKGTSRCTYTFPQIIDLLINGKT